MKEKKSLLSIVHQGKLIEQALISQGGELTPEVEQALLVNGQSLSKKTDNYKMLMDRFKMLKSYYADQAKMMTGISKQCENVLDRLEDNIKYAMKENNLTEIKGKNIRFTISETIGQLFLESEEMIPVEYKTEVTTTVIDKDKLKSDLIAGKVVEGASLIKGLSLRSYANPNAIKAVKKPVKTKKSEG